MLSTPALANFNGPSLEKVKTAQAALDAANETPIQLTGYITESLGNQMYRFKDATAEVMVEIKNENWQGKEIAAGDMITIYGRVDADKPVKYFAIDVLYKN